MLVYAKAHSGARSICMHSHLRNVEMVAHDASFHSHQQRQLEPSGRLQCCSNGVVRHTQMPDLYPIFHRGSADACTSYWLSWAACSPDCTERQFLTSMRPGARLQGSTQQLYGLV